MDRVFCLRFCFEYVLAPSSFLTPFNISLSLGPFSSPSVFLAAIISLALMVAVSSSRGSLLDPHGVGSSLHSPIKSSSCSTKSPPTEENTQNLLKALSLPKH